MDHFYKHCLSRVFTDNSDVGLDGVTEHVTWVTKLFLSPKMLCRAAVELLVVVSCWRDPYSFMSLRYQKSSAVFHWVFVDLLGPERIMHSFILVALISHHTPAVISCGRTLGSGLGLSAHHCLLFRVFTKQISPVNSITTQYTQPVTIHTLTTKIFMEILVNMLQCHPMFLLKEHIGIPVSSSYRSCIFF